ncbi:SurA N-terminal domain-containing protein [Desulfocurvus sp. DL9XJH121]
MLDGLRQHAGSWIIKILFGIIILAFVFAYGSGTLGNKGGAVLAYVDETPLLIKDFQLRLRREMDQVRSQMPKASDEDLAQMKIKDRVLSSMVNSLLIRQSAEKLGLTVADAEVKERIRVYRAFRNDKGGFDTAIYRAVLSSNNMTPAEFEAGLRADLTAEKLQRHLASTVLVDEAEARDFFLYGGEQAVIDYLLFPWGDFAKGVEPAQSDIEAYYEEHKERFKRPARATLQYLSFTPQALAKDQPVSAEEIKTYYEGHKAEFASPEQVRARHILLKLDQDAGDKDVKDVRAKLLRIKAELGKRDFAALAEKYSQGPSKAQGGDLGWFSKGMMVPAFEEAAFALKPGEVSDPVRTSFGWHLIKLEEHRDAGTETIEEATPRIKAQLAEEKAATAVGEKLDQGIDQIIVGDSLAKVAETLGMNLESTGPVTEDMLVQGLGVDADSAHSLFNLVPGKASETPVAVEGGYILVSKAAFVDATYAPVEKVKGAIVEALRRETAMGLAQKKADSVLAALLDESKAEDTEAAQAKAIHTSKPFGRRGLIPELGMNPPLVESVFAAPQGKWLDKSFAVNDGYVLVRPDARIAPPEEQWERQKPMLMAQLRQLKGNEMFMAYLSDLRDKAEIKIVEPRLLED